MAAVLVASGADWGRQMYTLGINAAFHDSSACLVEDGQVVAAVEEERFTRIKHGKRPVPFSTWELPFHAIDYCLREAAIQLTDIAHVAYSFDPGILVRGSLDQATFTLPLQPSAHPVPAEWEAAWDPLFVASMVNAPRQLASGAPHHLAARFKGARADGPYQWHFVEHHIAHAPSAFLASPFERAAVLTLDGRGEQVTTGYYQGCGNLLRRVGEVQMPHSLGILYEQVTEYLGFLHSSDEYKVMALASHGKPAHVDEMRELVHPTGDGGFVAQIPDWSQWTPPRVDDGRWDAVHADLAASVQARLEEVLVELASWLYVQTGDRVLTMAGGTALNCVANSRIWRETPFDEVWVQPAAGDAGTSLGAALQVCVDGGEPAQTMPSAALGRGWTDDQLAAALLRAAVPFSTPNNLADEVAEILAGNGVVGWFDGRSEYG